jgi:hypothetical protein
LLNLIRTENDGAAHLAANVVLARELNDHSLADRKDGTSEIARHDVFRPAIESSDIITHHSTRPKNAKRPDPLAPVRLKGSDRPFSRQARNVECR